MTELSAEWVRVATYYNRFRPLGSSNWGDLEVDVKKSWRKQYRRDSEAEARGALKVDEVGMSGVSREDINKWLALSGVEDKGADVQARGDVAEWNRLAAEEARLAFRPQDDDIPPEVTVKADEVNHPSHYTDHPSGVECIQITEHLSFLRGNAIKYLWRAGKKKDAIVDLEKAVFYIQREIQNLKDEWND